MPPLLPCVHWGDALFTPRPCPADCTKACYSSRALATHMHALSQLTKHTPSPSFPPRTALHFGARLLPHRKLTIIFYIFSFSSFTRHNEFIVYSSSLVLLWILTHDLYYFLDLFACVVLFYICFQCCLFFPLSFTIPSFHAAQTFPRYSHSTNLHLISLIPFIQFLRNSFKQLITFIYTILFLYLLLSLIMRSLKPSSLIFSFSYSPLLLLSFFLPFFVFIFPLPVSSFNCLLLFPFFMAILPLCTSYSF